MNHVVFVAEIRAFELPPSLTADFETKSASAAPILKKKMKVLLLSGGSDPPEVALPPRRGGSDPPEVARLTGGCHRVSSRARAPPLDVVLRFPR